MFGTVSSSAKRIFIAHCMALFFGAFLLSCGGGQSNADDCYYETYNVMVRVKNFKPHPDGDGKISVILDFDGSSLAFEDQELSTFKPDVRIDHDFIERNRMEIGNKYEATVSEISEGNCTPLFVSFHHDLN